MYHLQTDQALKVAAEQRSDRMRGSERSRLEGGSDVGKAGRTRAASLRIAFAVLILATVLAILAVPRQAMAKFYAGQPVPQDLTTLSDDEVSAYRWQAMANFYAAQPAAQNLTMLSDVEVLAYRWQAMARFYADQAAPTALTMP